MGCQTNIAMRRFCITILLILLYGLFTLESHAQPGSALPCNEIERVDLENDPIKSKILVDYIHYCESKEWKNDKGIVMLTEYTNEDGKYCWLLAPSIDDRYKDNPPKKFATFTGDIILIFEGDRMLNTKPVSGDKDRLNSCLEQLIGDRVYIRPTTKTRWADGFRPFTTERIKEGRRRIYGGNGGTLIIIFNGDGTFKKQLPV